MKLIRILLEQLKQFKIVIPQVYFVKQKEKFKMIGKNLVVLYSSILCLYNCSQYLNWLKAQIQRNYFKPKRPKINWSLDQIWAAAQGLDTPAASLEQ